MAWNTFVFFSAATFFLLIFSTSSVPLYFKERVHRFGILSWIPRQTLSNRSLRTFKTWSPKLSKLKFKLLTTIERNITFRWHQKSHERVKKSGNRKRGQEGGNRLDIHHISFPLHIHLYYCYAVKDTTENLRSDYLLEKNPSQQKTLRKPYKALMNVEKISSTGTASVSSIPLLHRSLSQFHHFH